MVRLPRQCSRPGCAQPAVATLTFVYAESVAVVGPLASTDEPHSWDLCDDHASRITVPRGWEMMRSAGGWATPAADEDDLTALAEAVREAGGLRAAGSSSESIRSWSPFVGSSTTAAGSPGSTHTGSAGTGTPRSRPRPGRRGHLRVLPDPID